LAKNLPEKETAKTSTEYGGSALLTSFFFRLGKDNECSSVQTNEKAQK
jgi:hypothetical protein